MERLRLKVCGMRSPEAEHVARLGIDYLGFIFYPRSPRYVGNEFTFAPQPGVETVGVFVNESRASMVKSLNRIGARIVQLHGDEQPADCEALRDLGYAVIKAIPVDQDFNSSQLDRFKNAVDYFLFDTKGKFYGGNASRFDWKVLERYDQQIPFFLSGGIKPEDIGEVRSFRSMNIHAVDLNSGVESSPGIKDIGKVKDAKAIIEKL